MIHARMLLLGALLLLGQQQISAQGLGGTTPDDKMLSKGSASGASGLSGLYNTNLYDGSATVNIPIYEYSAEGLNLGVSMSYNTKGIKVDEMPSYIGLHWGLNTNATITRVIKDVADEINIIDADTLILLSTNRFSQQPIPGYPAPGFETLSLNKYWCIKGKYSGYNESATSKSDTKVYRDGEADDFNVSIFGTSFTFNLGKNGKFFSNPHRNVKVELLLDGQPYTPVGDYEARGNGLLNNLLSFKITDEQGNQFFFKGSEHELKVIEDKYNQNYEVASYYCTMKWILTKVILANGGIVTYNYDTPVVLNGLSNPYYQSYSFAESGLINVFYGWDEPSKKPVCPVPSVYYEKLNSISYPNGINVSFKYNAAGPPYVLNEIKVSGGQNCLGYVFKQSTVSSRLILDSVLLNSCDSSHQETMYSFVYDAELLPERMDYRQDFFGYFNGKTSTPGKPNNNIPIHNEWFSPASPAFINNYPRPLIGLDRSSDISKMKAVILRVVKNAYGGSLSFYYGAHQMDPNVMTNLPTDEFYMGKDANDGLRLDSIIESDKYHSGNTRVSAFEYAGGQRFLAGGYFHYPRCMDSIAGYTNAFISSNIFTNTFLSAHQFVNGSNHGYTNVTVTTKLGTGALLSRKTIKFSNFKDDTETTPKYFILGGGKNFFTYPYTDKQYLLDWKMGLPLEITEYDQNNRIVQKTVNNYEYTIDTVSAINNIENRKRVLLPIVGITEPGYSAPLCPNREITDDYRPYTGRALLQSSVIRKYVTDISFVKDSIAYKYDARGNTDYIITINSEGQKVKTDNIYNYDIDAPLGSTIQLMSTAGLEKTVGMERVLLGTTVADSKLLDASINSYNYVNGKLSARNLYKLNIDDALSYNTFIGYTGGPNIPLSYQRIPSAFSDQAITYFDRISSVILSDAKNNPLEVQSAHQELYNAMIWDTTSGQKIAEVANAHYKDIAYTSFETGNLYNSNFSTQFYNYSIINEGVTGGKCFNMYNVYLQAYNTLTGTQTLEANKTYKLTFWIKGANPMVQVGSVALNATMVQAAVKGDWTQYAVTFTPASNGSDNKVKFTGLSNNSLLDEVRLFPANTMMASGTFDGLFGKTSATDATGRIAYYEYDILGRPVIVRDQDGNILSKTKTVVQGTQ